MTREIGGRAPTRLTDRFHAAVERLGLRDRPLLVAVSGGVDSMVLLHLVRFAAPPGLGPLAAAHLDHAMRPDSAADAAWVRGACRAWDVPLTVERADPPPTNEAAAREARYAFLQRERGRRPDTVLLTAHHADDQAETVLFRILRGTGLQGLAGMPERRVPDLARPLLGFWREEIEAYAHRVRLGWRRDPTNRAPDQPRAYLRHVALPGLERVVAPGARRSLVRLARLAGQTRTVLTAYAEGALGRALLGESPDALELDRRALEGLSDAELSLVLRAGAARLGARWSEGATERAVRALDEERTRVHVGDRTEVRVTPTRVRLSLLSG